jgi:hypothetical protein
MNATGFTASNMTNANRALTVFAGALLLSCLLFLSPARALAGSATVIVEGVPGGVVVETREVVATVVEIDKEQRTAKLQDESGKVFEAKAGPAAVNFDQVAVGDTLRLTLTDELVVYVDEEASTSGEVASSVVATAPKGEQPGGIISGTRQVVGTVTAIDLAKHEATLEFKDGTTRTFPVRKDVDLSQRKVGDKVVFRFTETLAISIEKP